MTGRSLWGRVILSLAALVVTGGLLELGLRMLERDGLRLDHWIGACQSASDPTPLHHDPRAGRIRHHLPQLGLDYEETFDEHGIKRSAVRPQEGEGARILFLGDSFIQGYDDANTVPQRAYEWIAAHGRFAEPVIVLNAAYSSYSPLIFTVQAKRLLPVVRPDVVVVDIDETDLFDDAVRYRASIERDGHARVIAIGRNPDLLALEAALARGRCHPLLLARLGITLCHQWRVAAFERRARESERLFAVAEQQGTIPPELQEQMRFFSGTLDELFATLKEFLPADRILIVRHPHLWHLASGGHGPAWNRKVGELVGAAAARSGVSFFDAQDELAARFANHPERYYWDGDMHLNFDGIRAYGALVGREVLRKLDDSRRSLSRADGRASRQPRSPKVARIADAKKRSTSWRSNPCLRAPR